MTKICANHVSIEENLFFVHFASLFLVVRHIINLLQPTYIPTYN